MKKKYLLLLFTIIAFASCITDDSTYAEGDVEIEISGIEDYYNVVSYSSDKLDLHPSVQTDLPESDLEYEWSFYKTASSGSENVAEKISDEKDLSANVYLPDGTYYYTFAVTSKSTGYRVSKTTTVYVASSLSKGFYVLKENAEGNSDLDLYNPDRDEVVSDVITKAQGKAVTGKPRHLDVVCKMAYLDETTDAGAYANLLSITTEDGDVKWIRALDGQTVKDATSCHYEAVSGEKAYRTVRDDYLGVYYITNKGVYTAYAGEYGGIGTFGTVAGDCGSVHAVVMPSTYSVLFWNEESRSIASVNSNGYDGTVLSTVSGYAVKNTDYDCLKCGIYTSNETNYWGARVKKAIFLLQDRSDKSKKVMYLLDVSYSTILREVKIVDPALNFANCDCYAVNSQQAIIAYGAKDNQLWAYDFSTDTPSERKITLEGISSNEKITYLCNKYFNGATVFDYLIVGTQSGNQYKLYFYNMVGGIPFGEPAFSFGGEGILRNTDYIDPKITTITSIVDD